MAFFDSSLLSCHFWPSLVYSVGFGRSLRGKMERSQCCRGSRVGCDSESYAKKAGGTPATTAGFLRREGGDPPSPTSLLVKLRRIERLRRAHLSAWLASRDNVNRDRRLPPKQLRWCC